MLRIPGVEIISEIGQGARGVVYRGSARGREVAVKVPLLANSSQQVHFCREGSLLACVSHPGLAQVFEVGLLDAQVYILTEFLEGATLAEELRHSPLSLARAEQLGLCLSGALAAIHQQGLVHRDIKPSNIVCTSHGPKLIDFGLAVRGDAAQTPFAGTLLYASPEQIGILKRPVDHRSDLYSLGVVLFECLAGRPPFWGEPADLVRQHAAVKPPDLRDLNPRVPHTLAAIVAKLLAKDPADRYASAAGLEADFHHLAQLQPDRLDQTAPAPPPLLGRETWLSELRGFWDAVRCLETGQLLLISGPAGAGKSSLLRHWLAEPQGAPVRLYLKCQEGEATPYQTARQAVEEMLSQLARLPAEGQTSARRRLLAANLRWATALTAFSSKFADLFGEVGSAGEACGDELPQALVEWLLSFARACGGMVVVMEDVHWLDEGSRQVLDRLQQRLEEAPLLMVLSSRQDSPAALRLEPLAEPEVEKMLSHLLGGAELPGELVAQMIQRTGSNPLAIQQFVRACLDQGVLRPSWGSWRVDQELLGRLRLPEDIYALILFRLEGLGAECARVLRVGAIQGNAFSLQVVAAVLEMDPLQVELALQTAIWEGLIERCPKRNLFQFAHDCLRQALTSGLPPEHLGQLHRQVAAVLEGDSSQVYAVARHYWLGGAEPARIWQTSLKAARQALADFAFESAYEFLQNCEKAQSGREDRLDYLDCLAQACEMTGRADRAYELLAEAIHLEQNALRRAQFRLRRCQLGLTNPDWGAGGRELQTALAEVGARRLPGGWRSLLAALPTFVRWRWLPSGRPTPAGRIRAQLYQQLAQVSFFRADLPTMVEAMARSALTSARLGPSRELVRAYCLLAFLAALLKRERESERCMARAQEIADQLGDRLIQRTVLAFQGVSQFNLDRVEAAHQSFVEALFGEGPRLPMGDYTLILGAYCLSLILRGAHREIVQALQHVHRAFGQSESGLPPEFRVLQWNQVVARAALARPGECPPSLEHQSGGARLNFLHRGNQLLVELFEGTACQVELLQELDRELVGRARDPVYLQAGYVAWTYAAYYRVLASEAAYRQEPTRLFERALKQLRLQLHYRVTSGHQACLQAALARLRGHFWQARQQLQRAEWIAHETDSPWLLWEVLAERSRLLASQGYAQGSRQVATRAQRLAQEQGWLKRAEAFAREASLVLTSSGVRESLAPSASSQMLSGLLQRRQIEALLQLSQASARILEPDRLAQIVLAEILKLFGGQRAVLVLGEREDYEVLAARTQEGPCPPQQVGYSKSLVSQVLTTGKSVLVNGNLQDNLGKSVVLQDLRSLMAVPLRLRNQLLGAVYLDSDQAHGLFSSDDQEILEGLASHIAVGLETARAMQMEVQLGREQHQRAWAEQLRDFAAQLVSATEVRQVFATLAERLQPVTLTGLVWRAEQLELAEGGSLESETWQLARRALASGQPEGQGRLWAVPCRSQQAPVGVFLLEDASQGQRELAETLSGYVGLALQKAVLFEQMHRIAHTDALTGIANRRHFFAMAEAHQGEGCLILLDVDHFKSFNDRFGHDVGDLVLQSVARGLWSELGPQALLARYGGEEFVVLLPGLELSAAFEVAERLRLAVPAQSEGPYQCHISLGLAERQPGEDLNSLLKRADEALYRAKAKGRNRCVVARL
ncbi:MAG: diguanylate cyclase [Vulcanimicrobiota bacterium]